MTATATSAQDFRDKGYLHLAHVIAPSELRGLQVAADKIIDFATAYRVPNSDYLYRTDPRTDREVFFRINNPKARSVEFQALYGHPSLLSLFEELIGPNFVVTDDALVVKLAHSGTDFPWHRDARKRSHAAHSLLLPGIDLDVSDVENGCVHVVPGSHLDTTSDLETLIAKYGFGLPGSIALESHPGDVTVHSANTLHGSQPNNSATRRRTVYVAAIDIEDYIASYEATEELVLMQMRFMLRGIQLRRTMGHLEDEAPFVWSGDPRWRVDLRPDDFVDWGLPAPAQR